jgi:very-long-chain enoyl-CoA reductase
MMLDVQSIQHAIAMPSTIPGYGFTALQAFVVASSYFKESQDPTLYSKFASIKDGSFDNDAISSRNGMLRIYVPSVIVAVVYLLLSGETKPCVPLLFTHFLKRVLEVLGLHKYSGTMPGSQANFIGTYYALMTLFISCVGVPATKVDPNLQSVGYGLFAIGILGNFYHHWLLARLRSQSNKKIDSKKKYVPPEGGLFSFVAAPHYFFEVIGWVGIGVVAQQLNAIFVALSMASYLSGRAKSTNDFYLKTFDESEWPRSRKAIIPGLF